ncbi:MAG: flagellar FlbD family protein [Armatimonadota bacterium]
MIKLTLYNNSDLVVNADLIESVESTPDTIIALTTGKKIMVKESVSDVISKVVTYKRLVTKNSRLFSMKNATSLRTAMKGFERWTLRQS